MAISRRSPSHRRRAKSCSLLTVAVLSEVLPLCAQKAEVRQSNVYYIDARGGVNQVTSDGMDADASLSVDGKTIIFVRSTLIPATNEEPTDLRPFRTRSGLLPLMDLASLKWFSLVQC